MFSVLVASDQLYYGRLENEGQQCKVLLLKEEDSHLMMFVRLVRLRYDPTNFHLFLFLIKPLTIEEIEDATGKAHVATLVLFLVPFQVMLDIDLKHITCTERSKHISLI